MKRFLSFLTLALILLSLPQDTASKKIWAKSFLNKKAPELVVETWISEKPDLAGKYVLIDFWATWCPPCRKAIPELNAFQKTFKDKLVIVGLSDEPEETIRSFKGPKIEYFSAVDPQARTKKAVDVQGIPHVMLIDPDGIVRWEGFPFLTGHELTEDIIQELMK